jgi:serine phosphatase RsbU (regulator of sigma subunit)
LQQQLISNQQLFEKNRDLDQAYQQLQQNHQQLQYAKEVAENANKKLNDSIDYAGLIQKSILPQQLLQETLGEQQCVLWYPRDVVGGDFYVFHVNEQGCLLGVIDCAGHGVPGSLMTMLAHAVLEHAINLCGIDSPALLLQEMDAILRNRLQNAKMPRGLATNMDAGLMFVEAKQQRVVFAGAKMSLYWSDGEQVVEIQGGNRTILGKIAGRYEDKLLEMTENISFCMISDGVLDQAGGSEGFGFGNTRFTSLFLENATKSVSEQAALMMNAINNYRGDYNQRDDITLLFFKSNR